MGIDIKVVRKFLQNTVNRTRGLHKRMVRDTAIVFPPGKLSSSWCTSFLRLQETSRRRYRYSPQKAQKIHTTLTSIILAGFIPAKQKQKSEGGRTCGATPCRCNSVVSKRSTSLRLARDPVDEPRIQSQSSERYPSSLEPSANFRRTLAEVTRLASVRSFVLSATAFSGRHPSHPLSLFVSLSSTSFFAFPRLI